MVLSGQLYLCPVYELNLASSYALYLVDIGHNIGGTSLKLIGVVEHDVDVVVGGRVHPRLREHPVRLLRVRDHGPGLLGLDVIHA